MKKKELEKLFSVLCEMFPSCYIAIQNQHGFPIFSNESSALPIMHDAVDTFYFKDGQFYFQMQFSDSFTLKLAGACADAAQAAQFKTIIKRVTALSIEREQLEYRLSYTQDDTVLLINYLFNSNAKEDLTYAALSGVNLGYDLSIPRGICVIDVQSDNADLNLKNSLMHSIVSYIKTTLGVEKQDIVAQYTNNRIILCKIISDPNGLVRSLTPFLNDLCTRIINYYRVSLQVGVGTVPTGIDEYNTSLNEAQTALEFSNLFGKRQVINFIEDYRTPFEMSKMDQKVLSMLLEPYLQAIVSHPQLLETIEALVQCNMDLNASAEALYIHRNTAIFRVNQIKKKLNLNPLHNDSDRFCLITLYYYYKMKQNHSAHTNL